MTVVNRVLPPTLTLKLPFFFPSYFLAVGGNTPFKRRYIAASA